MADALIVDGSGDVIRGGLDLVGRIAHRDARADVAEHLDVVAPVAKRNGFIRGDAVVRQKVLDAHRLVASFGDDIGKQWVPTRVATQCGKCAMMRGSCASVKKAIS